MQISVKSFAESNIIRTFVPTESATLTEGQRTRAALFDGLFDGVMEEIRRELLRKLKDNNCFWSYDLSKVDGISDEAMIEYVLLYLDIDDADKLFTLYGYKKVKRVWKERVAPQGEMFRQYNILYAWYFFGAKRPEAYVKSIETRHIHSRIKAANGTYA